MSRCLCVYTELSPEFPAELLCCLSGEHVLEKPGKAEPSPEMRVTIHLVCSLRASGLLFRVQLSANLRCLLLFGIQSK